MRQAIRRDAYEIIGVRPGASELEIKRAFRERARKMHPDATGGKARDDFLRLVEAYRETEAGRRPDQLFVEPPPPPKTLARKLIEKKWWVLLWSALAVALYIRSLPPADEPVVHDEPVQSKLVAHTQEARTVEPAWMSAMPSSSRSIDSFSRRIQRGIDLPIGEAQLPVPLRSPPSHLRGTVTVDTASEDQVARPRPAPVPDDAGPAEAVQAPTAVSVMPPRRPKHIGEPKKHHATAKKQKAEPEQVSPSPAPPAKSDPSLLGHLSGLLGLQ